MKLLIEKIPNLQALYVRQLRMLLWAEEMIMIKEQFLVETALDPGLSRVLREQVEENEVHAERLREILHQVGGEVDPLKCEVIYALFDEAEEMIKAASHPDICDVALIAAAQKIKHYQIASYGTVREFARLLNREWDTQTLDKTLQEKKHDDHALTEIAGRVNINARKTAEVMRA